MNGSRRFPRANGTRATSNRSPPLGRANSTAGTLPGCCWPKAAPAASSSGSNTRRSAHAEEQGSGGILARRGISPVVRNGSLCGTVDVWPAPISCPSAPRHCGAQLRAARHSLPAHKPPQPKYILFD